jgi:hypothetical protein
VIQPSLLAGLGDAPDPQPGSSDEFYTPSKWFRTWNAESGGFTVDTCATRESAKVVRFYDYLRDGLAQDYAGELPWTNPPYSGITPWVLLAWRWMATTSRRRSRSYRSGFQSWLGPLATETSSG